ncbi:hypothetical protein C8J56DRAFT_888279 [Mycena floridula]|nr:hypothetical protein C8J56DRAFT_888279 [Mycena floridula]
MTNTDQSVTPPGANDETVIEVTKKPNVSVDQLRYKGSSGLVFVACRAYWTVAPPIKILWMSSYLSLLGEMGPGRYCRAIQSAFYTIPRASSGSNVHMLDLKVALDVNNGDHSESVTSTGSKAAEEAWEQDKANWDVDMMVY